MRWHGGPRAAVAPAGRFHRVLRGAWRGAVAAGVLYDMPPALCHACSGPAAPALIAQNELFGGLSFVVSLVLAVGAYSQLVRRGAGWLGSSALPMLLALVHPGWWLSARHGDCGFHLYAGSLGLTAAQIAAVAWLLWRNRRRDERPAPNLGADDRSAD